MKWLLDTNTLSELTKPQPSEKLLKWLEENEADSAISAVSLGELMFGLELLAEGKKRRALVQAFTFLREDYAGKVLDFSDAVAVEWGRLLATARKAGRTLSVPDSQIEATAIHYGLKVVTRNSSDFFYPVVSPW